MKKVKLTLTEREAESLAGALAWYAADLDERAASASDEKVAELLRKRIADIGHTRDVLSFERWKTALARLEKA